MPIDMIWVSVSSTTDADDRLSSLAIEVDCPHGPSCFAILGGAGGPLSISMHVEMSVREHRIARGCTCSERVAGPIG